jgi:hypothetical protein
MAPQPAPSAPPVGAHRRFLIVLVLFVTHVTAFAAGYVAYSLAADAALRSAPADQAQAPRRASVSSARLESAPAPVPAPAPEGWLIPLGEGGDSRDWLVPLDRVSKGERLVVYTWANYAMKDFIKNFVMYMRAHGITLFVIGSMDHELTSYLQTLAHEAHHAIPVLNLHAGLTTGDFGWNSPAFKKMARSKFQSVQQMQSAGFDVVVVDSDVAWARNPLPLFMQTKTPDIMVSTDILQRMPLDQQLHGTLNIGIMLFRAREPAIDFVTQFYEDLVGDPHFGTDLAMWDQERFGRMARTWGDRVKFAALDVLDFCNGHVYYTQQLPQKLNHTPYMIHQTFQFGAVPGKRHRFREAMLWLADDDEWYDPPGGLMTYDHTVDLSLFEPRTVDGHFKMLNPQLAQFRTAWAVARALNRTLVMPRLTCGMDRAWFGHTGVFPGSDPLFTLPFQCPADHVFDLEAWQRRGVLNQLRESSLMVNPRMLASVKSSATTVDFRSNSLSDVELTPGLSAERLRQTLRPFEDIKVFHFGPLEPDAFVDWDPEFEQIIRESASIWCCVNNHTPGHVHYDLLWDRAHTDKHGRAFSAWNIRYGP